MKPKMKITKDQIINFLGFHIGYVHDDWAILFKSHYFNTDALIPALHHLNKKGYKVIFRPLYEHTSGFELVKVAKEYSADDIKTAVVVGYETLGRIVVEAYTYNQIVKGVKLHAEALLVDFINKNNLSHVSTTHWYMDLEPCYDCLKGILSVGATNISYINKHKPKWDTLGYRMLVEAIKDTIEYTQKEGN